MRSHTRRQLEEPVHSLDDSGYDFLSEEDEDEVDEDAHTESIASTDIGTPNDSDNEEEDADYERAIIETAGTMQSTSLHPASLQPAFSAGPSGQDSTLTEVPLFQGSGTTHKLHLVEERTQDPQVTLGATTIKEYPDASDELPNVLNCYGSPQLRLAMRAAFSVKPLSPPETYRILYIGMPDKWLMDLCTEQIGAALTASPSESRSVMIGGQIKETSGPMLYSHRCVKFGSSTLSEKQPFLHVVLDNGKELDFGPGVVIQPDDRPDLVFFFHSSNPEAAEVHGYASARAVFEPESIPYLNLTLARPYGHGISTYDSKSLRICVEGKDDADDDYEVKEVLPLDLSDFIALDPSQLNRHLSLISPQLSKPEVTEGGHEWATSVKLFSKTPKSRCGQLLRSPSSFIILFLIAMGLMLQTYQNQGVNDVESLSKCTLPTIAEQSQVVPGQNLPSAPRITPEALRNVVMSLSHTVASEITLASGIHKSVNQKKGDMTVNSNSAFEIENTGHHQFILRPSKDFSSRRSRPQLQITITQESRVVPARYIRTINGSYIVDLEKEYPVSNFLVNIATHSKPHVHQSFEITLGHDKSSFNYFLDTVNEAVYEAILGRTQDMLKDTHHSYTDRFRANVEALLEIGQAPIPSGEIIQKKVQNVKEDVKRLLPVNVRQIPKATWTGLKLVTAPVRTSPHILKARMNALRLRCKLETATGLWEKTEPSWACSKVEELERKYQN